MVWPCLCAHRAWAHVILAGLSSIFMHGPDRLRNIACKMKLSSEPARLDTPVCVKQLWNTGTCQLRKLYCAGAGRNKTALNRKISVINAFHTCEPTHAIHIQPFAWLPYMRPGSKDRSTQCCRMAGPLAHRFSSSCCGQCCAKLHVVP